MEATDEMITVWVVFNEPGNLDYTAYNPPLFMGRDVRNQFNGRSYDFTNLERNPHKDAIVAFAHLVGKSAIRKRSHEFEIPKEWWIEDKWRGDQGDLWQRVTTE